MNLLEYTDYNSILFTKHSPLKHPCISSFCGLSFSRSSTPQIFFKQISHRSWRARTYRASFRYTALISIVLLDGHGEVAFLLAEFGAKFFQLFIFEKVNVWSQSWFFRAQHLFELFKVSLLAILALSQYPLLNKSNLGSSIIPIPLDEMILLILVPFDLLFNCTKLTESIVWIFGDHRSAYDRKHLLCSTHYYFSRNIFIIINYIKKYYYKH